MGLHICYELSLAARTSEADVRDVLTGLREEALRLPFASVSELVSLSERDLSALSPMRGLSFERLEDVVNVHARFVREELYGESIGVTDEYARVDVPRELPSTVLGFAVQPGPRSEPAAFALVKLAVEGNAGRWWWHSCCKTQYASVEGTENLLRCHCSLVDLLDRAKRIGLECVVRDETGYWDSRDQTELITRVEEMNRIVARIAGAFADKFVEAGGDASQVEGEIFHHPDFERLETKE